MKKYAITFTNQTHIVLINIFFLFPVSLNKSQASLNIDRVLQHLLGKNSLQTSSVFTSNLDQTVSMQELFGIRQYPFHLIILSLKFVLSQTHSFTLPFRISLLTKAEPEIGSNGAILMGSMKLEDPGFSFLRIGTWLTPLIGLSL